MTELKKLQDKWFENHSQMTENDYSFIKYIAENHIIQEKEIIHTKGRVDDKSLYKYLEEGATIIDICRKFDLNVNTARYKIMKLDKAGLIEKSNDRPMKYFQKGNNVEIKELFKNTGKIRFQG